MIDDSQGSKNLWIWDFKILRSYEHQTYMYNLWNRYYVVMSSSLNYPSWAEPSQAGAFQFLSWSRAGFFFMYSFSSSKYTFFSCFDQFLNKKISHFKKKKYYLLQLNLKIKKFSENTREIRKKTQYLNFELKWKVRAEGKNPLAEPSWKSFSSSYGSSQLGSDSSLGIKVKYI